MHDWLCDWDPEMSTVLQGDSKVTARCMHRSTCCGQPALLKGFPQIHKLTPKCHSRGDDIVLDGSANFHDALRNDVHCLDEAIINCLQQKSEQQSEHLTDFWMFTL